MTLSTAGASMASIAWRVAVMTIGAFGTLGAFGTFGTPSTAAAPASPSAARAGSAVATEATAAAASAVAVAAQRKRPCGDRAGSGSATGAGWNDAAGRTERSKCRGWSENMVAQDRDANPSGP
ncbi:MAG: hypothetical protein JNL85_12255 [Rubrivivax sp.]|nr:hypothetical protein [Rubrivivax sp.]